MKKRAHPIQKKKPLDYPEETEGSLLAAKGRQMANSLTAEQRREHFRRGMVRIYGGTCPKETIGSGQSDSLCN